ncbi:glycosyltransferase family 2 protein [Methanonatronarchaeum sp. AMET6-2]|uniref:glycosyltransferase family 2 protein n=1 Tax=Methanonatronarchaeum sp. AMET6-2 TaxID=2933293 RepID=UPI00120AC167|nr:glycosyltransferase family 2 protein [Methanonatronarchaeum sp. AMET6-2]RZN62738.1 MAG: glycosyltransferase family 2 protein [Methanonatronarchaeia archaeon]UOY10335.1 glycosyltransferase family 2 protein [Methanonatronarchaeum sp. AMET6-2]
MKISVVIPTLNEETGIKKTLKKLSRLEERYNTEYIVVDGGSTDQTQENARELGAKVIQEERKGYGRAYKTGFKHTEGDIIITMDGDDSYPAENTPELLEMFLDMELDFMTTNRFGKIKKGAMSKKHRFGNWVLTTTTNLLFRTKLKDSQSGMWIFKKQVLDKIQPKSNGMPFSEEIKIEAARHPEIKTTELPIEYRQRVGEVVISSWRDGLKNLFFLIKKRIKT